MQESNIVHMDIDTLNDWHTLATFKADIFVVVNDSLKYLSKHTSIVQMDM